ncbi:Helix-turn-helix domain-containing protein, partial [bacterium A37T11]
YHITPKQYYLAIHLGECRRMLRDKHMTVKEVAYQRGYTDVRHFIRQYKKQFGKSPSA